jgi:hypothetical protein
LIQLLGIDYSFSTPSPSHARAAVLTQQVTTFSKISKMVDSY